MNVVVTEGVGKMSDRDAMFNDFVYESFERFIADDWGVEEEDAQLNREAKLHGGRLFGCYEQNHWKIYIIKDDAQDENSNTTIMFPDEY